MLDAASVTGCGGQRAEHGRHECLPPAHLDGDKIRGATSDARGELTEAHRSHEYGSKAYRENRRIPVYASRNGDARDARGRRGHRVFRRPLLAGRAFGRASGIAGGLSEAQAGHRGGQRRRIRWRPHLSPSPHGLGVPPVRKGRGGSGLSADARD